MMPKPLINANDARARQRASKGDRKHRHTGGRMQTQWEHKLMNADAALQGRRRSVFIMHQLRRRRGNLLAHLVWACC